MSLSPYEITIPQFTKMLRNLGAWLGKASAYAQKKSFSEDTLLEARLAPDQYPLLRQVQAACDAAKSAGARLAGQEPPKHPDTEKTMTELTARIGQCIGYLESLTAQDLEGGDKRPVTLPFAPGKVVDGGDFAVEMAIPNFYFHVTTAYSILRHNGVELGKSDYIGSIKLRDA